MSECCLISYSYIVWYDVYRSLSLTLLIMKLHPGANSLLIICLLHGLVDTTKYVASFTILDSATEFLCATTKHSASLINHRLRRVVCWMCI